MTATTGSATNTATHRDTNVQLFCGKPMPKRKPLIPVNVREFAINNLACLTIARATPSYENTVCEGTVPLPKFIVVFSNRYISLHLPI